MTTRDKSEDPDQSEKLLKLAVEIDERIKRKEREAKLFGDRNSQPQTGFETQNKSQQDTHSPEEAITDDSLLSDNELRELMDAEEALLYLDQVRADLSNRNSVQDQESLSFDTTDSTASGDCFGRFQNLQPIGEGGFARVFRAFDPQLNREVALKIPKPDALVSAESKQRFEREAKAAAMLSHPAIVTVFEAGQVGPVQYIAANLCHGQTLANWFSDQERPIGFETIAQTLIRLADAVHHAHQRGIIHRDLKPANVLLEQLGEGLRDKDELSQCARITDFGLAKQLTQDDATITIEGSIVGTPAYMSPEQVRCDREIGPASDIYSLGVILYELITGQTPHKKQSVTATIRAVELDAVPAIGKLRSDVPLELEAICLKCLEKEPEARYRSAFELAEDLGRFVQGKPILARRATPVERLFKWMKRNPAIAACLAITFLTLVAGVTATYWLYRQSEADRVIAVEAKNDALESAKSEETALRLAEKRLTEMQQQMDLMTGIFQELSNSDGVMDVKSELRKNILQATDQIFASDTEAELRIDLASRMGTALTGLRYGEDGLDVTSKAIALAETHDLDEESLLQLKIESAFAQWSMNKWPEAISELQPIIDSVYNSSTLSLQTKIRASNSLASSYRNRREFDRAKMYFQRTIDLFQQEHPQAASPTFDPSTLSSQKSRSSMDAGDDSWKSISTVGYFVAGFQLAKIEFEEQPNEQTLSQLVQRQKRLESVFGSTDFRTVGILVSTSLAMVKLKNFDDALVMAKRAHAMSVEIHGEVSWQGINALNAMNVICGSGLSNPKFKQEYPEILALADEACRKYAAQHGDDGIKVIGIYGNVASGYSLIKRAKEAVAIRRRLVSIAEKKYGRLHEVTLTQLAGLGFDLHAAGQNDEACKKLEEVIEAVENDSSLKIETLPNVKRVLETILQGDSSD